MFVMVLHEIANPELFWKNAGELLEKIPTDVQLHHTFSTPDGSRAVCIWEAEGIDPVKNLLTPTFAGTSIDTFVLANNKEGVVGPPQFMPAPMAAV